MKPVFIHATFIKDRVLENIIYLFFFLNYGLTSIEILPSPILISRSLLSVSLAFDDLRSTTAKDLDSSTI
jgi:hypothetical protein